MRKSNIEILRLLSMLLIVLSHWGGHGSYNIGEGYVFNEAYILFTNYLGEVGNCVFLLITGYFGVNRENVNWKGVKRVVVDVKFYAFLIWMLFILLRTYPITAKGVIGALLPIVYPQYWFVLPFLLVIILAPFINNIISNSNKKQITSFFIVLAAIELIMPVIHSKSVCSNLGLFILYYSVGALIGKNESIYRKLLTNRWWLSLSSLVVYLVILCLLLFKTKTGIDIVPSNSMAWRFSPIPLMCAIGLFMVFSLYDITSKNINSIAKSAFAVYLISENPNMYPNLWKLPFFDSGEYGSSFMMIPFSFLITFLVLCACVFIDQIIKKLFVFIATLNPLTKKYNG